MKRDIIVGRKGRDSRILFSVGTYERFLLDRPMVKKGKRNHSITEEVIEVDMEGTETGPRVE